MSANESLAQQSLERIKAELERNTLLLEDFPKAVYPLHRIESQSRRCVGQLYEGARTCIVWQRKRVVMPTMPGPDAEASGAILHVAGITGAIRGLSQVDPVGKVIRPDILLIDDPEDREAAGSAVQTEARLRTINGDLLALAGPGKPLAALCTCTVIYRGDLSDQLLDAERNPAWQGERYGMVKAWPTNQALWDTYLRIRDDGFKPGGDKTAATRFYAANRAAMDDGAIISWPALYAPGEVSAIQHAVNLRADRGETVFASEYQNQPIDLNVQDDALDPVLIAQRCNGQPQAVAPIGCEKIVAAIDCGQNLLWYTVCGFDEHFTCNILDYGSFPPQRSRMYLSRNASPSLEQIYSGGVEAALHQGLHDLVDQIIGREWMRSDGFTLPVSRILVDQGWQTHTVRQFIRQSTYRDVLIPSKGQGITAIQAPMADWRRKPGEKSGDFWFWNAASSDKLRLLKFDANLVKNRAANMLRRPAGMSGGIWLYGDDPHEHQLLSIHLGAESPTLTQGKGQKVVVWEKRPDSENHMLDCLCGCIVGASIEGLSPLGHGATIKEKKRERVSFAAQYAQARMRRNVEGVPQTQWRSKW